MTYKFQNAERTDVIRDDGANVPWNPTINQPLDIGGQAGRLWRGDGAPAPNPYVAPPPPKITSVSNFQGRAMLRTNGLFTAVQAAITAISDPLQQAIAQEAFDRADFSRSSPLLISVATTIGKTATDIDAMFTQAAAIKV